MKVMMMMMMMKDSCHVIRNKMQYNANHEYSHTVI